MTFIDKNKTFLTLGTVLILFGGVWYGASQASTATNEIAHLKDDIYELKQIVQLNSASRDVQYTNLETRVRELEITCLSK